MMVQTKLETVKVLVKYVFEAGQANKYMMIERGVYGDHNTRAHNR